MGWEHFLGVGERVQFQIDLETFNLTKVYRTFQDDHEHLGTPAIYRTCYRTADGCSCEGSRLGLSYAKKFGVVSHLQNSEVYLHLEESKIVFH